MLKMLSVIHIGEKLSLILKKSNKNILLGISLSRSWAYKYLRPSKTIHAANITKGHFQNFFS